MRTYSRHILTIITFQQDMTLSLCQLLEAVAAMILLCLSESQHISATGPYLKGQRLERHIAMSDEEPHSTADVSSTCCAGEMETTACKDDAAAACTDSHVYQTQRFIQDRHSAPPSRQHVKRHKAIAQRTACGKTHSSVG